MKLIDVGEIKDSLLPELLSGVDGGADDSWLKAYEVIDRIEKIVNEWIDSQPTVEAIPIEWIKKYKRLDITDAIKMPCTASAFDIIRGWNTCLDKLLKDWEKENEREID